ncbi:HNH endonuclease [Mesorhizobium hunchu]|jgi:hypothetical protein|uniref:HNH endonuclease n=1 Tax=Mesorhizobium hunchu TaxID=3157708 RepID=UPI003CCE09D6
MKFRKPLKITQRTSSITNSFVQSIIPWVPPTEAERAESLEILGIQEDDIVCAYCGAGASDWDHLRPLVRAKRPTGYISDYKNLVPACGRCNQSKGAQEWRSWISGKATGSPSTRGVADLKSRIEALERFEAWGNVQPIPLEEMAPAEMWKTHWDNLLRLEEALRKAQEHAALLQFEVHRNVDSHIRKT